MYLFEVFCVFIFGWKEITFMWVLVLPQIQNPCFVWATSGSWADRASTCTEFLINLILMGNFDLVCQRDWDLKDTELLRAPQSCFSPLI